MCFCVCIFVGVALMEVTLDVRAFHLRSLTLDIVKIYLYDFSDTILFYETVVVRKHQIVYSKNELRVCELIGK